MLQPDSADEIFDRILVAVETGDDSQLLAVTDDINDFLERFPEDERGAEIQSIADEMELTRVTRVLARKASREGGPDELSAIEQGFLDCMTARSQDFHLACEKLNAFIQVFDPIENLTLQERRLVKLAKYAAASGVQPKNQTSLALMQLEDLVRSAEKTLSGKDLEEYYEGLLLLYADKPWARVQIARIRQQLKTES
jgi:hypothetical protein